MEKEARRKRLLEWRERGAARTGGKMEKMEECVPKEGCVELKFQKWNNPEIQSIVMEVD